MYLVRVNQSCVCNRNSRQVGGRGTIQTYTTRWAVTREFLLKYVQIVHFYAFSTILTALFCPYIAHEGTAHNLDYVNSLVALCLTERHRSQNEGSLKSEERLSDFEERCTQLCKIETLMNDLW